MKILPLVTTLCAATLLLSCGRPAPQNAEADKEEQDRLAEEQLALQQSQLHEREAALDERERQIGEREQQVTAAAMTPVPAQPQMVAMPPPQAPATPAAPSVDASYQAFYDILAPYGSWIEMPGYGYVWQPAATAQDYRWRPYTLGNWTYTDQGWTWVSDEPFGWITYHYGRWMRTRTLGWVWTPGDQWAPAWVSWRYGNDFVGWAPLPPEARFDGAAGIQQWADQQYNLAAPDYTFVPAAEFGDDNMALNEVPPDQEEPVYDESNNVTNIYYAGGAIICYGPNYDFMRSKCRRPLPPPLKLARGGFRSGGNNGPVVSGNTLHVTAPRIVQGRAPSAPKMIRGQVADIRLVSPPSKPPAPGSEQPALYHPPANTQANAPANVYAPPASRNPSQINAASTTAERQPAPQEPGGMRIPSQMNPAPLAPAVQDQKAHDMEIIRQEQDERDKERQKEEAEAARAAQAEQQRTNELRAEENAREQQRAAEEAARTAHAQEATARAQEEARAQASRAMQPVTGVPGPTGSRGQ